MTKTAWWKKIDLGLTIAVVLIIGFGLLTIYSSTFHSSSREIQNYFQRQVAWVIVGIAAFIVARVIPVKVYYDFAYLLYGISIFSLVLILFINFTSPGTTRWLNLGAINIQPSEFAKITTVLALARFLSERKTGHNQIRTISIAFLFVLIPFSLIFEQPDLGTCIVYASIIIPMLFWAGISISTLVFIVSPFISVFFIILFTGSMMKVIGFVLWMGILTLFLYIVKKGLFVSLMFYVTNIFVGLMAPYLWARLKPYQQKRILVFLNPEMDPHGAGYQILQSQTAIGSGGMGGKGYLQGTQTQLRFLPEQHTDFIFSVFGEEFGFLGVSIVLILFFFVVTKSLLIASWAKNRFASLAALGLTTVLVTHLFINIGMTVGLMPVTGLPLPFMSYGGSALLTFVIIVGILNNISVNRLKY